MEAGIMNKEDFDLYRRAVGFRNIAVHEYITINLDIVSKIIREKEFERIYLLAVKIVEELKKRGVDP